MNAKELIREFRHRFEGSPVDPRDALLIAQNFCSVLAEHWYGTRLHGGKPVRDAIDSKELLGELAVAAEIEQKLMNGPPRLELRQQRSRFDECPTCGHIHRSEEKCGEDMGGAGECLCERKVSA